MSTIKRSFQFGEHEISLETSEIARQADGAVVVDMAGTVVLVTAVARKTADSGRDFFPLTVNYQEKTYAAGKIPGGFFKREGRPSEKDTLTSRLIDRPVRPLFPKGFKNEVQVIATVMSMNPDINPDIPALIGASAALSLSGISLKGAEFEQEDWLVSKRTIGQSIGWFYKLFSWDTPSRLCENCQYSINKKFVVSSKLINNTHCRITVK